MVCACTRHRMPLRVGDWDSPVFTLRSGDRYFVPRKGDRYFVPRKTVPVTRAIWS